MSVLASAVIVLAPFVEGIGVVERVLLQLGLSFVLLATGFMFGTMVDD